jgi:predicted transcriptional regulator
LGLFSLVLVFTFRLRVCHVTDTIRQEDNRAFESQDLYLPYRTQFLARILLSILMLPLVHALQGSEQRSPVVFPPITSYSLDKSKVNLPADLAGQTNLLLISFAPEQQKDIDTWMPLAQALQHTNFNFRWYRLPVSERENFIFRWWENSSMRSEETDPETWPWIVPLYVNKDEFRAALQIQNEREIVALLIDKQGHVLWRASGALTPNGRATLTSAMGSH